MINPQEFGINRDQLMELLKTQDIDTRPLFPPLHLQPIYNTKQSLPVAEYLGNNGISLPGAVTLSSDDLYRIIKAIKKAQQPNVLESDIEQK